MFTKSCGWNCKESYGDGRCVLRKVCTGKCSSVLKIELSVCYLDFLFFCFYHSMSVTKPSSLTCLFHFYYYEVIASMCSANLVAVTRQSQVIDLSKVSSGERHTVDLAGRNWSWVNVCHTSVRTHVNWTSPLPCHWALDRPRQSFRSLSRGTVLK